MGRQSQYTEEFRRDAVALYRAGGGTRTYAAVASDLGISGETLRTGSARTTPRRRAQRSRRAAATRLQPTSWRACGQRTPGCAAQRRNGSSNVRFCAGQPPISRRR